MRCVDVALKIDTAEEFLGRRREISVRLQKK